MSKKAYPLNFHREREYPLHLVHTIITWIFLKLKALRCLVTARNIYQYVYKPYPLLY